jgi:Mg2+/Co2+ transporter CorB
MNLESKSILEAFEQNELKISRLYKIYSEKIPHKRSFWEKISKEEIQHAEEIRGINKKEEASFEENKFHRGIIRNIFDFIEVSIREVEKKKLSHVEALNVALRIEQSFLEKKSFEIFAPNQKTVKEVLQKLNLETEEHIKKLQNELKNAVKN